MIILGLTGGIGMGKSTVAAYLRRLGYPVHNADAVVHDILRKGGAAVARVGKVFPETLRGNAVDRQRLGTLVFHQPDRLRTLEKILHPLVQKEEKKFLTVSKKEKVPLVVLEIPLLFETGAEARCDQVLCVTASAQVQKERVLKRADMTESKFKAILKNQMADAEKKRRADFVVRTDQGLAETKRQVAMILKTLLP